MSNPDPALPDLLRIGVWARVKEQGSALVAALKDRAEQGSGRGPERRRRFRLVDLCAAKDEAGVVVRAFPQCDVALLVTDAASGLDAFARRQALIAHMTGLRHLVLAVQPDEAEDDGVLARIDLDIARFAAPLDWQTVRTIRLPLSDGAPDGETPLLAYLAQLPPDPSPAAMPFRMALDEAQEGETARGMVVSGRVRPGDTVVAAGSGRSARVLALPAPDGERPEAEAGEPATIRLDAALDAPSGEVLAAPADRPESCDQFAAQLLWLDDEPLLPGRAYTMRIGARQVAASVTRIKHRIDAASPAPLAAGTLRAGDRGQVNLSLAESVVFEPFARNPALGLLALAERVSGRMVAVGRIDFALRRAANIHRQAVDVTKAARAEAKAQRPALLWFTGLSGAGKSTIANLVERRLFALGHHTYLLDGDNVRHGLNRDLGFTAQDRVENIRRVAETAKLMVDAGLITLASFISPFRAERRLARDLLAAGEFVEVFVDAPLGVAEARDPKGLYAQARAGRIPNFTGIDSPYEPPEAPELHLETDRRSAEDLADDVVAYLGRAGFLGPPID